MRTRTHRVLQRPATVPSTAHPELPNTVFPVHANARRMAARFSTGTTVHACPNHVKGFPVLWRAAH